MPKENDGIFSRKNTIFCKFENDALEDALKECAHRLGCQIFWGTNAPDIIAIPYFIGVIDRKELGILAWGYYLDYLEEIFDGKPLIVDGELIELGEESPLVLLDEKSSSPDPEQVTLHHCSPTNISKITELIQNKYRQIENEKSYS